MKLIKLLAPVLLIALIPGCAPMSKKECLNADWESIGYGDGSRGVHFTYLEKRRESCREYEVIPDDGAYRHGWDQGIRLYCTHDNGYRAGKAGRSYNNICPEDVEEDFLSGWYVGIGQYCSPENALNMGLSGYSYSGACPAELSPVFRDFYQLGQDVRAARREHENSERYVRDLEHKLAAEQDPGIRHNLLRQLEQAQHNEELSERRLIALEGCMNSDWFDAGFQDGEEGYPRRPGDIAAVCRNYGIGPDHGGYNHGWQQGVMHYCTYESGLYLGQSNRPYSGVCAGPWHQRFWQGYEQGRQIYRSGRYEAHPRPEKQKAPHMEERRKSLPSHVTPPAGTVRPPEKERESRTAPAPLNQLKRQTPQPTTPPVKKNDSRDKAKTPLPENSKKPALQKPVPAVVPEQKNKSLDKIMGPAPDNGKKPESDKEKDNPDRENSRRHDS